jgi:hypothetical protein
MVTDHKCDENKTEWRVVKWGDGTYGIVLWGVTGCFINYCPFCGEMLKQRQEADA